MSLRNSLAALLLIAASTGALAEQNKVVSPDGRLVVNVEDHDGKLYYDVAYDGKQMMQPSLLGVVANVGDFSQMLTFKSVDNKQLNNSYTMRSTKTSAVNYRANEMSVTYINDKKLPVVVKFRVSDNDIAFRYEFGEVNDRTHIIINEEKTAFRLPSQTTTFLSPQSDPMIGWKRTKPSYEEEYTPDAPMTAKSKYGKGYTFPCLFHVGQDGWVLVSETGTHGNYPGCRLSDYSADNGYTLKFPMEGECDGRGAANAAFPLPGATPWRTITVGSTLKPIVETTVSFDNVEPMYEASEQYKAGRYVWSWLIWQDNSANYDDQKQMVDLAATMGYEYVLVDGFWTSRQDASA